MKYTVERLWDRKLLPCYWLQDGCDTGGHLVNRLLPIIEILVHPWVTCAMLTS